jgi:hypothetical protein
MNNNQTYQYNFFRNVLPIGKILEFNNEFATFKDNCTLNENCNAYYIYNSSPSQDNSSPSQDISTNCRLYSTITGYSLLEPKSEAVKDHTNELYMKKRVIFNEPTEFFLTYNNTEISNGTPINHSKFISSNNGCTNLCNKDSSCIATNFDSLNKTCTLYSTVNENSLSSKVNSVSSLKSYDITNTVTDSIVSNDDPNLMKNIQPQLKPVKLSFVSNSCDKLSLRTRHFMSIKLCFIYVLIIILGITLAFLLKQ